MIEDRRSDVIPSPFEKLVGKYVPHFPALEDKEAHLFSRKFNK